jgi:hypothetical protein
MPFRTGGVTSLAPLLVRFPLAPPPPPVIARSFSRARSGRPNRLSVSITPCEKRHSFLSFPYACPEPVLVK